MTLGEFAIIREAQRIRAFGIKDRSELRVLAWDRQIRAQLQITPTGEKAQVLLPEERQRLYVVPPNSA